jgi:glycosyltransferase involved in cell wall biosynthesis
MRKVEASILAPAVREARIIPNGVDLSTFRPRDRRRARKEIGISQDCLVVLFAAWDIRANKWKDYATMRSAVAKIGQRLGGKNVLFVALGEDFPTEKLGPARVMFVPYQDDPTAVVRYYSAADVYIHAARADTFPTAVLEAMACGLPVVATAVGGIPEQVRGLRVESYWSGAWAGTSGVGPDEATGILTPAGDVAALAEAMTMVLENESLRSRLGANGRERARRYFNIDRQISDYTKWYGEIVPGFQRAREEDL